VILRGEEDQLAIWRKEVQRLWRPQVSVFAVPTDVPDLPPAFAAKTPRGAATAYVCRGEVCAAPADTLSALLRALSES
jgi:uncharacterized protein YyaL (SSP411 family)